MEDRCHTAPALLACEPVSLQSALPVEAEISKKKKKRKADTGDKTINAWIVVVNEKNAGKRHLDVVNQLKRELLC